VLPDEALLEAWRGGDARAGSELLSRYFPILYRFFANKVGNDVDDLIQQTLLACVHSRDSFRGEGAVRTYFLRIARSKLYDHFRGKLRDRVDPDFGLSSVQDLGTSPSSVAGRNEQNGRLLLALRGLPTDLQVALELFYWEELSIEELSAVLEIPSGTAKSRLRRAREALAERLGDQPPERLEPPAVRHDSVG